MIVVFYMYISRVVFMTDISGGRWGERPYPTYDNFKPVKGKSKISGGNILLSPHTNTTLLYTQSKVGEIITFLSVFTDFEFLHIFLTSNHHFTNYSSLYSVIYCTSCDVKLTRHIYGLTRWRHMQWSTWCRIALQGYCMTSQKLTMNSIRVLNFNPFVVWDHKRYTSEFSLYYDFTSLLITSHITLWRHTLYL